MKSRDLQNKNVAELEVMLKDRSVAHGQLSFEHANDALKNTSALGAARKDIARIKTRLVSLLRDESVKDK